VLREARASKDSWDRARATTEGVLNVWEKLVECACGVAREREVVLREMLTPLEYVMPRFSLEARAAQRPHRRKTHGLFNALELSTSSRTTPMPTLLAPAPAMKTFPKAAAEEWHIIARHAMARGDRMSLFARGEEEGGE